jgi:hypothetical protein
MLMVHYAIRQLMHQAALDGQVDPDRILFVRSLRVVRRQVTQQAGVSPFGGWPRPSRRRWLSCCGSW